MHVGGRIEAALRWFIAGRGDRVCAFEGQLPPFYASGSTPVDEVEYGPCPPRDQRPRLPPVLLRMGKRVPILPIGPARSRCRCLEPRGLANGPLWPNLSDGAYRPTQGTPVARQLVATLLSQGRAEDGRSLLVAVFGKCRLRPGSLVQAAARCKHDRRRVRTSVRLPH